MGEKNLAFGWIYRGAVQRSSYLDRLAGQFLLERVADRHKVWGDPLILDLLKAYEFEIQIEDFGVYRRSSAPGGPALAAYDNRQVLR